MTPPSSTVGQKCHIMSVGFIGAGQLAHALVKGFTAAGDMSLLALFLHFVHLSCDSGPQ